MTLNASGPICLGGSTAGQSINLELGQSSTAQVSLNDSNVRSLAGVVTGAISMPTDFWGKSTSPYRFTFFNVGGTTIAGSNMFVDSSGNTYIASDYGYVLKFDSSGSFLWGYNVYQSGPADYRLRFAGINVDSNGNVYLSGSYGSATIMYEQLIKLSSSGTVLWQRLYSNAANTPSNQYGSVLIDSAGDIYWLSNVIVSGTNKPTITKLNSSGTELFQKTITVTGGTYLSARIDSSNNLYITGYAGGSAVILKLDSNANILWQRSLSYSGQAVNGWDLVLDSANNIYILAASPYGYPNGVVLIKYNTSGTLQWKKLVTITSAPRFANLLASPPIKISIDSLNNVYFAAPGPYTGGPKVQFIGSVTSDGALRWLNSIQVTGAVGTNVASSWGLTEIDPNGYLRLYANLATSTSAAYFDILALLPASGTGLGSYTCAGVNFQYLTVPASVSDATSITDAATSVSIADSTYYPYVINFYTSAYTTSTSSVSIPG